MTNVNVPRWTKPDGGPDTEWYHPSIWHEIATGDEEYQCLPKNVGTVCWEAVIRNTEGILGLASHVGSGKYSGSHIDFHYGSFIEALIVGTHTILSLSRDDTGALVSTDPAVTLLRT